MTPILFPEDTKSPENVPQYPQISKQYKKNGILFVSFDPKVVLRKRSGGEEK